MTNLRKWICLIALVAIAVISPCAYAAGKAHVLVISIDGMRPDYITQADKHGLKVPTLRKLMASGTYAEGVVGVIPTLTYPSHTTMMTGVWPIEHGVFGNQEFRPFHEGKEQITDFSTIKVPTLWEAAKKAGYTTGSVGWPVTTGAACIDWLLPANAAFEGSDPDGGTAALDPNKQYDNPRGLKEQLASVVPKDRKLDINQLRHIWYVEILKRYKPEFMTIHTGDLDHQEHAHGPFSPEANASIEAIDREVAELVALERSNYPDAYILIVSDHGFLPTEHTFYPNALLAKEGLLDIPQHKWEAAAYNTGGTSTIIVRDPSNAAVVAKVKSVVEAAAKNPAYGIGRMLTHEEAVKRGGNPAAMYILDAASGWRFGSGTKKITADAPGTGAHGQLPDHPELRSSFFLVGPDVVKRNLGVIDMRQIAPTLAKILNVKLPSAKLSPVKYTK
ncbi:MAG: alkaline phosphatase family protein [Acidobacteria bacterium]|nr:alkaline phosphatase family protein [Acidobacteriota bacterium]